MSEEASVWQLIVRAVSVELQVVVGRKPKSAEKVDLPVIFLDALAERASAGRLGAKRLNSL